MKVSERDHTRTVKQNSKLSDLSETSQSSSMRTARISKKEFAEMIAILCTSKLHVELDKPAMLVWWKLLCPFGTKTIRRAILSTALRSDPFPNLGSIFEECRRIDGAADDASARRIPERQLSVIAKELGWS